MHQLTALNPPQQLPPTWREDATCRRTDAENFFAPAHFERKDEKDERERQARALCRSCPVQKDCLDYSLAVREAHGIWGGLNELERRRVLRQRAAAVTTRSA